MAVNVQMQTNNKRFLTCIYAPEVQTFGNQKITLKENHDWRTEAEGKSKEYHSLSQCMLRFLESAEGLFRFGQLLERAPKLANAVRQELGIQRYSPMDTCTEKSLASWTWLTTIPHAITMTPGVLRDVKDAYVAKADSTLTSSQKRFKIEKAARELTDAAAMYSYSFANVVGLFPSTSKYVMPAVAFGDGTTLVHDAISLKINSENYLKARSIDLTHATPAMKATVEGTKSHNMWAVLKDTVAVAGGIFGMLFLLSGIALVPKIVLATFSLASTVFAVIRKMSEETMNFKPISFLDTKHVTLVTA